MQVAHLAQASPCSSQSQISISCSILLLSAWPTSFCTTCPPKANRRLPSPCNLSGGASGIFCWIQLPLSLNIAAPIHCRLPGVCALKPCIRHIFDFATNHNGNDGNEGICTAIQRQQCNKQDSLGRTTSTGGSSCHSARSCQNAHITGMTAPMTEIIVSEWKSGNCVYLQLVLHPALVQHPEQL